jgi:hypothetical protein
MIVLCSIFLLLMGAVMLLAPEFIYELKESWKSSTAGAPSQWYIIRTRFGGVCCIAVGIAGIISVFIL